MPLKGIPAIISPDLLYVLSSAGHGDEIVLADAHFPTSSLCRNGPKEIRADGNILNPFIPKTGVKIQTFSHTIPQLLEAILKLFPLDSYVPNPEMMSGTSLQHQNKLIQQITHSLQEIISCCRERDPKTVPKVFKVYLQDIAVMDLVPSDKASGGEEPPVWAVYTKIATDAEKQPIRMEKVERFAFYERSKTAFAIVHTGELSKYGNLIIKKGLVL